MTPTSRWPSTERSTAASYTPGRCVNRGPGCCCRRRPRRVRGPARRARQDDHDGSHPQLGHRPRPGHRRHAESPHPRLHRRAQAAGATIALGGGSPAGKSFERGYWIEPTILTGVTNDMEIAREEIFGPVLSVIPDETPTRRSRSPTTASTGSRPRSGGRTTNAAWPSPLRCSAAASGSTTPTRSTPGTLRRLQAERGRPRARPGRPGRVHPSQSRPRRPVRRAGPRAYPLLLSAPPA